MKVTRYSINFDFIEDAILNLGNNILETQKELSSYESGYRETERAYVHIVKRLGWLDGVRECLREIYDDVNVETKNIIKLLYLDNIGFEETCKRLGIKENRLLFRHNLMVDEMLVLLGMVSEGESKKRTITRRAIPQKVKDEVFDRDEGKCVECFSGDDLHYHHIKRYASGGKDSVENLILLCVNCHAEEHKDESSYRLLKAMAER